MESIQLKTCSKCKIEKPISEFSKHKGKPDGYRYSCKQCEKIPAEAWRKANPDYQKDYYLDRREETLARQKLYRQENLEAIRLRSRISQAKNKEARAAYASEWVKANPEKNRAKRSRRRALELSAKTYLVTSQDMGKLYSKKCVYCGSMEKIEIDHVIPLSRGGSHSIGNLVPSCQYCNRSKGSKTIMEWRVSHS